MSKVIATIHASVAGRLRVKLPSLLHQPALARRVEQELLVHPDIKTAQASSTTGSLLITYPPSCKLNTSSTITRALDAASNPKPVVIKAWWCLSEQQTLLDLGVSLTGLTASEASERYKQFGANVPFKTEDPSRWALLFRQFSSLPIILLCASTAFSVATGGLLDAGLVAGVVAANVIIGYSTETKAEAIIKSYMKHEQATAVVRRDERPYEIAAEDVVPGDIMVLSPGTVLVADARVLASNELAVDKSLLTGESAPVTKVSSALRNPSLVIGDRTNMVFCGTIVASGTGLAVVVATATATEFSRIGAAVAATEQAQTPMQRQLDRLGTQLTVASVLCSGVVFGLGFLRGTPMIDLIRASTALAVAAIPEGLPTVATSILATGLREMQRHNVLIRRLAAVETLGSVSVLCFDKTGTLTQNRMAATSITTNGHRFSVLDGFTCQGEQVDPSDYETLMELLHVATLCSDTEIQNGRDTQIINGSATEAALLVVAIRAGINIAGTRRIHPMIDRTMRNEQRRYMKTVHENQDNLYVAVKGNPVDVLGVCDCYMHEGTVLRLGHLRRSEIITENDDMASRGLRVLGFACHYRSMEDEDEELIWLGMVGLTDPARPGMQALIEDFHHAGIRTVMLTGDQSGTALAVANELSLAQDIRMLDGTSLSEMPRADLLDAIPQTDVFSRVSPLHKLDIVQALQADGQVVAMTGDGTNDSPALRAADIGVTMGMDGTDAARQIADVILAKDDLTTMIIAIRQGRTIYSNIRKAVHFLVSTNSSEVMLTMASTGLNTGQPLNAPQLLWLNLVTDVAIALSLGFEQPETDVMQHPPRPKDERIVTRQDYGRLLKKAGLYTTSALATHLYGMMRYGPQGGGIAFTSLIAAQLLDGFSSRSETKPVWSLPTNRYLTNSVLGLLALQVAAMLWPVSRNILGVVTLDLLDLAVIAGGSVGPFLAIETFGKADSPMPVPMLTYGGTVDEL